jgi:hypothetical protein
VTDLHRALAEIHAIRGQLARGMDFRGYGPATVATTGALAIIAALIQAHWLSDPARHVGLYLWIWIPIAAVSLTIISIEAVRRAQRVHVGLVAEMVLAALEQFVPAIVVGLMLTMVLFSRAPQSLWMLPGLWQLLFSLGVFSSRRFLPRQIFAVGMWYLVSGLICLAVGSGVSALSPWMMGVPFGIGQLLVAAVLQFGYHKADEP